MASSSPLQGVKGNKNEKSKSKFIVPDIKVDPAPPEKTKKFVSIYEQSILQDKSRLAIPAPNLEKYVTVPVPEKSTRLLGEKSGKAAGTPAESLQTMHIFINNITQQPMGKMEIVPDPSQHHHYLQKLTDVVHILICLLFAILTVILGIGNYVYSYLAETHAKVLLREIYTPSRRFGSVWEFCAISMLAASYAVSMTTYPDPKDWRIKSVKCNRLTRWIFYFLPVMHLAIIYGFWCYDMPGRASVKEYMLGTMNKTENFELWKETQFYFECCGTEKPQDWSDKRRVASGLLVEIEDIDIAEYFPRSCCNFYTATCDFPPDVDDIFTDGCLSIQLATVQRIHSYNLILGLAILIIAFAIFFNIYVLEILVLKFQRGEASSEYVLGKIY